MLYAFSIDLVVFAGFPEKLQVVAENIVNNSSRESVLVAGNIAGHPLTPLWKSS